jgi:hypothetical protein
MFKLFGACFFILTLVLAGCGQGGFRKEITETRRVNPVAASPTALPASHAHPPAVAAAPFEWQLPEGWTLSPPRPVRLATFSVAGNGDVDCYLTSLSGNAGGIEANVNRWRGQLGLPPATPEELAAMPKIEMLGRQATLVEAAGEFQGMDSEARPGWMLLGAVVELDGETLFAKMTGPEQAVRAEKDLFVSFCNSIEAVAR